MLEAEIHWSDTDIDIHKIVVGPIDNNVFFIRCKHTGESIMIDAADEHEQLLNLCKLLDVRTVLETHGHWDHIQAVPEIRDAGYEVGITAADAAMLPSYDYILEDDKIIEVGRTKIKTMTTPGHTPGSICFEIVGKPLLFSGDTLFPGGPGRTDLEGGDFQTVLKSIDEKIFQLPKDTIVIPGHGGDTTIAAEQANFQTWVGRGW